MKQAKDCRYCVEGAHLTVEKIWCHERYQQAWIKFLQTLPAHCLICRWTHFTPHGCAVRPLFEARP